MVSPRNLTVFCNLLALGSELGFCLQLWKLKLMKARRKRGRTERFMLKYWFFNKYREGIRGIYIPLSH